MHDYLVNRDLGALHNLVLLLQEEEKDPSMQEAILTVPMKMADVDRVCRTEDYLKLSVEVVDAGELPVHEDKLIRVVCSDQAENTCMILRVTHLDDKVIKLGPPIGGVQE